MGLNVFDYLFSKTKQLVVLLFPEKNCFRLYFSAMRIQMSSSAKTILDLFENYETEERGDIEVKVINRSPKID